MNGLETEYDTVSGTTGKSWSVNRKTSFDWALNRGKRMLGVEPEWEDGQQPKALF